MILTALTWCMLSKNHSATLESGIYCFAFVWLFATVLLCLFWLFATTPTCLRGLHSFCCLESHSKLAKQRSERLSNWQRKQPCQRQQKCCLSKNATWILSKPSHEKGTTVWAIVQTIPISIHMCNIDYFPAHANTFYIKTTAKGSELCGYIADSQTYSVAANDK